MARPGDLGRSSPSIQRLTLIQYPAISFPSGRPTSPAAAPRRRRHQPTASACVYNGCGEHLLRGSTGTITEVVRAGCGARGSSEALPAGAPPPRVSDAAVPRHGPLPAASSSANREVRDTCLLECRNAALS
ncbi:hypothetical protein ACP70R_003623 [Stipagrostis hirtigluma subsp. patula]